MGTFDLNPSMVRNYGPRIDPRAEEERKKREWLAEQAEANRAAGVESRNAGFAQQTAMGAQTGENQRDLAYIAGGRTPPPRATPPAPGPKAIDWQDTTQRRQDRAMGIRDDNLGDQRAVNQGIQTGLAASDRAYNLRARSPLGIKQAKQLQQQKQTLMSQPLATREPVMGMRHLNSPDGGYANAPANMGAGPGGSGATGGMEAARFPQGAGAAAAQQSQQAWSREADIERDEVGPGPDAGALRSRFFDPKAQPQSPYADPRQTPPIPTQEQAPQPQAQPQPAPLTPEHQQVVQGMDHERVDDALYRQQEAMAPLTGQTAPPRTPPPIMSEEDRQAWLNGPTAQENAPAQEPAAPLPQQPGSLDPERARQLAAWDALQPADRAAPVQGQESAPATLAGQPRAFPAPQQPARVVPQPDGGVPIPQDFTQDPEVMRLRAKSDALLGGVAKNREAPGFPGGPNAAAGMTRLPPSYGEETARMTAEGTLALTKQAQEGKTADRAISERLATAAEKTAQAPLDVAARTQSKQAATERVAGVVADNQFMNTSRNWSTLTNDDARQAADAYTRLKAVLVNSPDRPSDAAAIKSSPWYRSLLESLDTAKQYSEWNYPDAQKLQVAYQSMVDAIEWAAQMKAQPTSPPPRIAASQPAGR